MRWLQDDARGDAQIHHVPRPPRDRAHVDGGARGRPAQDHAARGTRRLRDDDIYLREAENLSQSFGAIFPALPGDLLRGGGGLGSVSDSATMLDEKPWTNAALPVELTRIELYRGDFE